MGRMSQGHEHVKVVLGDELLALFVQEPFASRSLARLALNGDRPGAILIGGEGVDCSCVSERDRGDVAHPGKLGGDEILARHACQDRGNLLLYGHGYKMPSHHPLKLSNKYR